ncbi:hypothetical protein NM208_g11497 [Fusarium decemcellulare]|uniref:Uncharacterized protein n=1 Tax=Fusarium decemcellulare TaxID=57161 RepID=A0ACC1RSZ9_9HYPO|nr:hypothetical protein NM208_g11497 [Fusarium decemcellulare]
MSCICFPWLRVESRCGSRAQSDALTTRPAPVPVARSPLHQHQHLAYPSLAYSRLPPPQPLGVPIVGQGADSREPTFLRHLLSYQTSNDFETEAIFGAVDCVYVTNPQGENKRFSIVGLGSPVFFNLSPQGDAICISGPKTFELYRVSDLQWLGTWKVKASRKEFALSDSAVINDVELLDDATLLVEILDPESVEPAVMTLLLVIPRDWVSKPSPYGFDPFEIRKAWCVLVDKGPCRILYPKSQSTTSFVARFDMEQLSEYKVYHNDAFQGQDTMLTSIWPMHGTEPSSVFYWSDNCRHVGKGSLPVALHGAHWNDATQELTCVSFQPAGTFNDHEIQPKKVLRLDDAYEPLNQTNAPSNQIRERIRCKKVGLAIDSYKKSSHCFGSRTLFAIPRLNALWGRSVIDIWDLGNDTRRCVIADRKKNFWIGTGRLDGFSPNMEILKVCSETVGQEDKEPNVELWSIP